MNRKFLQSLGTLGLCLLLAVSGIGAFQKKGIPVAGRIESRKLPVYCVQTDSPRAAISFDAAWGNAGLR